MTDILKSIQEYEADVKRPGKFEGEARYVPYFWNEFLNGAYDRDDGKVITFYVTKEDKKLFPELKHRRAVKLVEQSDGFVVEI